MLRLTASSAQGWRTALYTIVYSARTMPMCACTRVYTAPANQEIAVVGGGISGLTCATSLAKQGFQVSVFDLGKHNPGGRMSTRRTTWQELQFDHGCQFFRVTTQDFQVVVDEWEAAGITAHWDGDFGQYDASSGAYTDKALLQINSSRKGTGFFDWELPGPVYVGNPSQDSLCTHLSKNPRFKTLRLDMRVTKAHLGTEGSWLLEGMPSKRQVAPQDKAELPSRMPWNLGVFDALVVADAMVARPGAPGEITVSGADLGSSWATLAGQRHTPLFALMMAFEGDVQLLPCQAASIVNSPDFVWLARNDTKPGRQRSDGLQCWVAITTQRFATELVGSAPDGKLPPQTPEYLAAITPRLWEALGETLRPVIRGGALPSPAFLQCHRWGAALPTAPAGAACIAEPASMFAACGDFCLGAGVENAVLSGLAAADAVREMLQGKP